MKIQAKLFVAVTSALTSLVHSDPLRPGVRVPPRSYSRCTNTLPCLTVINTAECRPQPSCDPEAKYRTIDGSCSNLEHPSWGQAGTPFTRLLPAHYEDGKSQLRQSVTGRPLPNERLLSTTFFPDRNVPDTVNTLNVILWGQLIAHDFSHIQFPRPGSPSCCTQDNQLPPPESESPGCYPMEIHPNDYFYSQFNVTCLGIYRAFPVDSGTCHASPIEQINNLTHVIDASMVYGSDLKTAYRLRSFIDGKLIVQTTPDGRNFPPNTDKPFFPCNNDASEHTCYDAGDDRVNQNSGLTVLQIALLRLHNYLCDKLMVINPQWNDETLYHESRRILDAFINHVLYKHLLPIMLGEQYMHEKGLLVDNCCTCCINYHNPDINPSTITEFAGAAYRTFHSLIPRVIALVSSDYEAESFVRFDDTYFKPSFLQNAGVVDKCMRGFANQPQQTQDHFFTQAVTNLLFKFNKPWGFDLETLDLHRSLDLGLPTYNDMRQHCGLTRAKQFSDFVDVMSEESIKKLESTYVSVEDVHLYLGGVLEELIPDTLVGPTFQCIIGQQFYQYMRGDRFYYENCGLPWSFTRDQLNEIYKMSVAWMFCVTGDDIQTIQYETFQKPSKKNPIGSCNQILAPDFSPWKE
uniref:Peroxidase n=1 Tax=Graphocephala atropunctata TaxID=36148 RepID=A0A1B6LPE8_9HEMI